MALNCSMITPTNDPVPLPSEKIFISVKAVTIHLNPTTPGAGTTSETLPSPSSTLPTITTEEDPKQKGKLSLGGIFSAITLNPSIHDGSAHGTVYVTNQRILFIADDAASQPDELSPPPPSNQLHHLPPINTLTIPLKNSFDGRFVQPWLSANYHLSTFIPVPNGNLDHFQSPSSTHLALDSFTLKIIFNEGHGFEFTEALEEVKRIIFQSDPQRPAELEELPTYSPPINHPIPLTVESPRIQPGGEGSSRRIGTEEEVEEEDLPPMIEDYDPNRFARRETLPEADLLLAASIATQQEHNEQLPPDRHPPLPSLADHLSPIPSPPLVPSPGNDAPPGYEP